MTKETLIQKYHELLDLLSGDKIEMFPNQQPLKLESYKNMAKRLDQIQSMKKILRTESTNTKNSTPLGHVFNNITPREHLNAVRARSKIMTHRHGAKSRRTILEPALHGIKINKAETQLNTARA